MKAFVWLTAVFIGISKAPSSVATPEGAVVRSDFISYPVEITTLSKRCKRFVRAVGFSTVRELVQDFVPTIWLHTYDRDNVLEVLAFLKQHQLRHGLSNEEVKAYIESGTAPPLSENSRVVALALPTSSAIALQKAGYEFVREARRLTVSDLQKLPSIGPTKADQIYRVFKEAGFPLSGGPSRDPCAKQFKPKGQRR